MKTETTEEFIHRKLSAPDHYSYVVKARRIGLDESDLSDLARRLRTSYYSRYGFHGGSIDLFRILIRDIADELASRPSQF